MNHSSILLGTSSFTATGWQGSFYPKGLRPADYLSYYAQHFDTVEIDSTFYATPNVSVVRSWNAKTPEGFLFAAKVPQEITHKRVLKDCDEEFKVFLTTTECLSVSKLPEGSQWVWEILCGGPHNTLRPADRQSGQR